MDLIVNKNDPDVDLHSASSLGDVNLVKELILKNDSIISKKNGEGWTPLMYACFYNHKDVVEFLIAHTSDKSIVNNKKQTLLMLAACYDDVDLLELVYVEDQLNNTDIEGKSALVFAVVHGCIQSAKWLLKHNADPNYVDILTGNSLIMIAIEDGKFDIVKLFFNYNINLEIENKNGENAITLATKKGYYNLAMLLEAHKAENNLNKVFEGLSLQKYWPLMEKHQIDLSKFLTLSEADLKNIGITLLGPRRKMLVYIFEMNARLMDAIKTHIEIKSNGFL